MKIQASKRKSPSIQEAFAQAKTTRLHVFLCAVLFVVLPLLVRLSTHEFDLLKIVTISFLEIVFLSNFLLLLPLLRTQRTIVRVLSVCCSLYYLYFYFQGTARLIYGSPVDLQFVSQAGLHDTWFTLLTMYGLRNVLAFLFGFLLLIGIFTQVLLTTYSKVLVQTPRTVLRINLFFAIAAVIIVCAANLNGEYAMHAAAESLFSANPIEPFQPNNSDFSTSSKEHVFILQMESVNALAVNGYATDEIDTKAYEKYMPVLTDISKKHGVLMPMFWGNTIQTHRAMMTMLCGAVNNLYAALPTTVNLITSKCLPQILSDAGYETFYYSAFDKPNFENKDEFTKHIGIKNRSFAEYMKPEDPKLKWGYEDCSFYERTLDDLKEKAGDKPVFAYISVSSHHIGFTPKASFSFAYTAPNRHDAIGDYLNSESHQDYCLQTFFEKFAEWQDNAHLFILSDHSFPVGLSGSMHNEQGATSDNFLVPLSYVPPGNRSEEFAVGSVIDGRQFSQADFIPTILELLNGNVYKNSFSFALRTQGASPDAEQNYENCHILTQPYNDTTIVVVRGSEKYNYVVKTGTLTHVDLRSDILEKHPTVLSSGMSYEEFQKEYFCERYKEE